MTHIFYLFGILAIIWEAVTFRVPSRIINFQNRLKSKKFTNFDTLLMFFGITYVIWMFVGLLTSQWWSFLALVVLSLIPKGNRKWLISIDGFISLIILLFILINKYHLHIKLTDII